MISFFGTCTCFERRDTIVEQAFEASVQNLHFGTPSLGVERSIDDCGRTCWPNELRFGESSRNAISHLSSLALLVWFTLVSLMGQKGGFRVDVLGHIVARVGWATIIARRKS